MIKVLICRTEELSLTLLEKQFIKRMQRGKGYFSQEVTIQHMQPFHVDKNLPLPVSLSLQTLQLI